MDAHVLAWNAFRTFGPLLRFDPHVLPPGEDPAPGVWYGALTPEVALGEVFQVHRTIDRERNRPYVTGLSFTRPLSVLDLAADSEGAWTTRAGGTLRGVVPARGPCDAGAAETVATPDPS